MIVTATPGPDLHFHHGHIEAAVFGRKALAGLEERSFRDLKDRKVEERRLLASWFSMPEDRIVFLDQVHGPDCVRITAKDLPASRVEFARADALFTMESNVLLVVRTADCLPIFFYTEGGSALCGLLHAGWRGLARGVLQHTLGMVLHTREREQKPKPDVEDEVHIFPGPYIPGSAYEVGPEVASRFALTKPLGGGKSCLDLYANARLTLVEQLRGHNVEFDDPFDVVESGVALRNRFFSHRLGDAGRNLNVIRIMAP